MVAVGDPALDVAAVVGSGAALSTLASIAASASASPSTATAVASRVAAAAWEPLSWAAAAAAPATAHINAAGTAVFHNIVPALSLVRLALGAAWAVFTLYTIATWLTRYVRFRLGIDAYAHLPAPRPPVPYVSKWTFPILGHLPAILRTAPAQAHVDFLREVSSAEGCPIYTYRTVLFQNRLFIGDPKAIAYILSSQNSYDFEKPKFIRQFLASVLGEGILVSEGDTHRRARRVLQPAFTLGTIRALTPIFFKYALQLRRSLLDCVDRTEGAASQAFLPGQSDPSAAISSKGKPVLDISIWLSLATMDIIGEAGFGYEFNAVEGMTKQESVKDDIVRRTFVAATRAAEHPGIVDLILMLLDRQTGLNIFSKVPTKRARRIKQQYELLCEISKQIIAKKKKEVLEEMDSVRAQYSSSSSVTSSATAAAVAAALAAQEKGNDTGAEAGSLKWTVPTTKQMFDDLNEGTERPRDIIHQMLRANLSKDLPETLQLRDDEMLPQISTLLLAGQETTSTQLMWCLYLLAQPENKHCQTALRQEVRDVFGGREEVRHDELQSIKLLDHVMLETMRLRSAVPSSIRVPKRDHVLPLSQPYVTRDGKSTFDRLPIYKGQDLFIFIQALNRAPHLWGDDADAFNPGRWERLPDTLTSLSPDWSSGHPSQSLWSFLAGPRGCIGRTFAIAEFKALLATLIRDLEYDVIPDWEIEYKQDVVLSSRVKGQEHLKRQMPLRISRAAPEA